MYFQCRICKEKKMGSLYCSFFSFSGQPISWAMLNPSVSPFKISANGLVVESSNPAVRLYRYNTYTGEVNFEISFWSEREWRAKVITKI